MPCCHAVIYIHIMYNVYIIKHISFNQIYIILFLYVCVLYKVKLLES